MGVFYLSGRGESAYLFFIAGGHVTPLHRR